LSNNFCEQQIRELFCLVFWCLFLFYFSFLVWWSRHLLQWVAALLWTSLESFMSNQNEKIWNDDRGNFKSSINMCFHEFSNKHVIKCILEWLF
jgi:hypothetical protein